MKNLIALFAIVLFVATAQSQSLTKTDVTGTWLVVNVENSSSNSKIASAMNNAVINFYADNTFEVKERSKNAAPYTYTTTTNRDATWSFNESNQTVSTTRSKMTFKISKSGDKTYFTDKDSGLKFEVMKPI